MEKLLAHQVKTRKHLIPIIILSLGIILLSYLAFYQANKNHDNYQALKTELFSKPLFKPSTNSNHFNQLLQISQKTFRQI